MKRLSLILLPVIFIGILYSCNNETSSPTINIGPTGLSLSGTLPGWSFGSGYYLAVCVTPSSKYQRTVLDSCAIGTDGSFSVNLPVLDDKYYDDTVNYSSAYCFDSIVIQPPYLKDANTVFEIHKNGGIRGAVRGKKHMVGMDSVNTYYLSYRAFNSGANITGHSLCYENHGTYVDTTYTVLTINLNKGWNTLVSIVTAKSNGRMEYLVHCTDYNLTTVWDYYINP